MVALQIRDVPDEVRDRLAAIAHERGQSLQAMLLKLVTEEARRSTNLEVLRSFSGRTDGSRLTADEALKALDAARAERDSTLLARPGTDPN